jgi:carboxypeptidase Taq
MTQKAEQALTELKQVFNDAALLGSTMAVLGWDERTYMPKNGSAARANQLAYLAGLVHDKTTSRRVGELLSDIEGTELVNDPLSENAVNVRELRRYYDKQTKVPKKLVEAIAHAETTGQGVWVQARRKSDFKSFQVALDKMIDLKKQYAEAVGYANVPYDALLDDYEPGASTKSVTAVLGELRKELVPFVKKIIGAKRKPDLSIIQRSYPVDRQRIFGETASAAIGFNFESGRLDVTEHPFCTGVGPGDTRITTRYNANHLGQALFGTLHESGHAIYDQGLPKESYGMPMGSSVSLGIHESQSRMWENFVGRSKSFWQYFYPLAQSTFHESLADVKFEDFYFAINDVRSSYIRVEADEVTYNLHILLRFEIEQDIFNGKIKTKDMPAVWNERFKKYFGIVPKNDAEGCLQDIHWAAGLFGYFPTYALGNLYAAQFFAKAKQDLGNLDQLFASGQFGPLREWLRKNIHSQGQRYRAEDLVKVVTGKPLDHKPLMKYLTAKFAPLYGVK